jgi:mRNA interferase RelE/StbE
MAGYKVYFRESVEKDFKSIPVNDVKKILHRIELLAIEPRPQGGEKLTGRERYRVRQGRYRILYSVKMFTDEIKTGKFRTDKFSNGLYRRQVAFSSQHRDIRY